VSGDADARDRKRRRVRVFQRYVLNPPAKAAIWLGVVPRHALLETTGRVSGKPRRVPVGVSVEGDTVWIVSEHGRGAAYVRNLEAEPSVRLRMGGRWRTGRATIVDDDDPEARLDSGRWFLGHVSTVRRVGTDLTSIRIDLDRS